MPVLCWRRRLAAGLALLAGAFLLLAVEASGTLPAAEGGAGPTARARQEGAAARRAAKKRRDPRLSIPRLSPAPQPNFQVVVVPPQVPAGDRVVVTVRLMGGRGPARYASFHLDVNPEKLRYVGHRPTGRGALLVEESPTAGELVVYRSSLPEGFAEVEPLLEVEYESLAPGDAPVFLVDVRLMDSLARDLSATHEATTLFVE